MSTKDSNNFAVLRTDRWLQCALVVTTTVYTVLLFLKPSGESWGRGWNMIAFWIFASPVALLAGGVALWRAAKESGSSRKIACALGAAALAFPLVAVIVIKART